MKFRKKPVVIDAIRWTGDNYDEINNWTDSRFQMITLPDQPEMTARIYDVLHETWVLLRDGDWVIRGVRGEYYPCANDVFESTYEPVPA